MWEEEQRLFGARSKEQLAFFADHGHWPEQCCVERNCMKAEMKAEFDKLKAELSIQN